MAVGVGVMKWTPPLPIGAAPVSASSAPAAPQPEGSHQGGAGAVVSAEEQHERTFVCTHEDVAHALASGALTGNPHSVGGTRMILGLVVDGGEANDLFPHLRDVLAKVLRHRDARHQALAVERGVQHQVAPAELVGDVGHGADDSHAMPLASVMSEASVPFIGPGVDVLCTQVTRVASIDWGTWSGHLVMVEAPGT